MIRLAARRRERERAARLAAEGRPVVEAQPREAAEVIELDPAPAPARAAGDGQAGEVLALPLSAEAERRTASLEWGRRMFELREMAAIRRVRCRLPREALAAGETLPDDAPMLPVSEILPHLNHRIWLGAEPPGP